MTEILRNPESVATNEFIKRMWEVVASDPGKTLFEERSGKPISEFEDELISQIPKHLKQWRSFSLNLINNPARVVLHEPKIVQDKDLHYVEHWTGNNSYPIENLELKYSIMETSADNTRSEHYPPDFRMSPPQIYMIVREIFTDSERAVRNIIDALIEEHQNPQRSKNYGERMEIKRANIQKELGKVSSILFTDLTMIGKVMWFDTKDRIRRPLNIIGFRLLFNAGGNIIIHKLPRWRDQETYIRIQPEIPDRVTVRENMHPFLDKRMRELSLEIKRQSR